MHKEMTSPEHNIIVNFLYIPLMELVIKMIILAGHSHLYLDALNHLDYLKHYKNLPKHY